MYSLNAIGEYKIATTVDTYIYDLIPLSLGLALLCSDDTIRVLDPLVLTGEKLLSGVGDRVTCCTALNTESVVAVAGRDGHVRIWDFRKRELAGNFSTDGNAPILSLASCHQYGLAGGSELTNFEASVFLWDLRQLGAPPLITYSESHSDDVTELQFHPNKPNFLLSGSTDGLVNVHNTSFTDDEALHQIINHGASIHHCDFLNDQDIFALSHDEKFSVYQLTADPEENSIEKSVTHFGDVREALGGEYVAKVVRRPDGSAVMGIGTHSQEKFDFFQLKNNFPWSFVHDEKVTLEGAHGPDIVRSFCFLDNVSLILSNSDMI
ncbi:hypothetical protein Golomagni_01560 [Golovinomyces magnicellulatus]|nr:hypothetical protein Golomagni_01560 [Golovinomyces magnicellulatus]